MTAEKIVAAVAERDKAVTSAMTALQAEIKALNDEWQVAQRELAEKFMARQHKAEKAHNDAIRAAQDKFTADAEALAAARHAPKSAKK